MRTSRKVPNRRIASELNIPESTVAFWVNSGILPDLDSMTEIAAVIIGYFKGQLEEEKRKKTAKGGQNALIGEQTRLAAARAYKIELENAVKEGELMELAAAEKAWEDYLGRCRKRLLGLPDKTAAELALMDDPDAVRGYLQERINEALWELSRINFENEEPSESEGEISTEGVFALAAAANADD